MSLILIFDQILLLVMGIFTSSSGRWSSRLVFFGLLTGLTLPVFSAHLQEDSLYKKVNRNEWIRKADSTFVFEDDYRGAEKYYLLAIKKVKNEDPELLAYSYIKLSNVYISLTNYNLALSNLMKAKKMLSQLDEPHSLIQAEYDLYLGKYLLRESKEMDSARIYIERSVEIKRRYYSQNVFSLAESLFFQAELYKQLKMLTKAEEIYREVQTIYERYFKENNILLGRLYSQMSTCLRDQFDFKNALDYAERAVQILKLDSLNNLNRLITATYQYANIYTVQDDFRSSIPIYNYLLKLIQGNDQMHNFLFIGYWNLTRSYFSIHQMKEAELSLSETHRVLNMFFPNSTYYQALTALLDGEFYLKKNELQTARKYLLNAFIILKSELDYDKDNQSYCYELLGDTYIEANKPDSALHYYQNAIIILLDNFNNENIHSNPVTNDDPNKRQIFDILYKKARAWKKYYELDGNLTYLKESLSVYNLIDRLNDQSRNSKLKDASLLIISDFYHDGYEMALDCAWELYRQTKDTIYLEQAFQLMEKSKSMLLFRSLVQAERSKSINLPYSIKQREDSLRMLNVEYEQKIGQEKSSESPDPEVLADLESRKFQVVREIENLRAEISESFPSYYQIRYDSLTKNINDFKHYCNDYGLTGIEYYWGNQAIYLVATNGSDTDFIRIGRIEESDRAFHRLLIQLSSGTSLDHLEDDYRNYIRDAYLGYQYLLGGLDPAILQNQRLLIIPDGNLAQLPFEALLVQPEVPGTVDYRKLHYLILDKSISYSYSFNFIQNHQQPDRKASNENILLAFSYSGISDFSEDNPRAADEFELFYSSQELNAIKKIIPKNSRFFYGEKATEHQFKKLAPEYELIHLAVHGFADTLDGDNSRLIFKKGQDMEDDSILYMHELYGLDLSKADLAVLSACESGIGEEFRGEGVFSMARGFFYAGCPSIIMSLWRVSDKYSAELMGDFYQYLKRGKDASSALRQSKLDLIKKQDKYNTHPVNWASFVYLGEEFQYKKQSINLILIAFIFIVIGTGIYFLFRLRRS